MNVNVGAFCLAPSHFLYWINVFIRDLSVASSRHAPKKFRRRRGIYWKHTGVFTALEDRTCKQPQDVLGPGIKDCQAKYSLSTGLHMLSPHTLVSVSLLSAHWRVAKPWPFPNALCP